MIEIAFDKNDNDEFLNKIRPVVEINNYNCEKFSDYWALADEILQKYEKEQIIVIRNNLSTFSSNLFAVALFVSSCLNPTKTECVVFKVKDYIRALQTYKPYVALTIALKYAIRLYDQSVTKIYKEIANMGYLGIDINMDYIDNIILMSLNNGEKGIDYIADNIEQAIIVASTLKAFSLLQVNKKYGAKIYQNKQNNKANINFIILQIIENVLVEI